MNGSDDDLQAAVVDYLTVRRAFGFKLHGHDKLLADFVDHLHPVSDGRITTAAAVSWATSIDGVHPGRWKQRLGVVIGFARHMHGFDPSVEVPTVDLLPYRYTRPTPYLFSSDAISGLLDATVVLRPELRAVTHRALFGLLAVTGMRVGEAINVDRDDVNLVDGVVSIRATKFNKSRQIPLHPTTVTALEAFTHERDRLCRHPQGPNFFVSTLGTHLFDVGVHGVFRRLICDSGIVADHNSGTPQIHSLRHSFAVTTMRAWYRNGDDVMAKMPLLSAYLGHSDPISTYWYLQACPELLGLAAERLEQSARNRS